MARRRNTGGDDGPAPEGGSGGSGAEGGSGGWGGRRRRGTGSGPPQGNFVARSVSGVPPSTPRKKRPVTFGTEQRRAGTQSGPVKFRLPKDATEAEKAQAQEYVDAANKAKRDGELSPTGRVSVKGQLAQDKDEAAAAERTRAANDPNDTAYGDDVAAHLPDTTWTGKADPPGGWGRHTNRINSVLGSQSGRYPEGYQPTEFSYEVET
ncbi:hypothetical protein SAMN05421812_101283 [Asanoa hainanensis]|uniref:Uncharacterized protein n=1 Tax=Asanoa hainanensis TaxID=560556 RepID=A0A239G926_9ACTN|nr:hypothetical protein [Asanoa hainanensis]SNS65649.1 hypothetical protein SAMN05421812_101283 [Asanoa hainanensis]